MGTIVSANCGCGFNGKFAVGGGMDNYADTCLFPCLCGKCRQIVHPNLFQKPLHCPKCGSPDPIPYDDPRLVGSSGTQNVASWYMNLESDQELVLTNGTYLCPSCGKMTLCFRVTALFD